jgi:hypothetical protein
MADELIASLRFCAASEQMCQHHLSEYGHELSLLTQRDL